MYRFCKRALHLLVRLFWTSVLLLVICLAVLVQFGRELFPLLDDYRPIVQEQLSYQLGAEVTLGGIEARWRGLRPRVILHQVAVRGGDGAMVFTAERVRLEIALLSTALDWRLAIRQFHFHQLESTLIQNPEGQWRVQGLPDSTPSEDAYRFDDPLDIFLFGRRIELTETRLHLRLRNGVETVAEMPNMTLENDAQFHRLVASFTLGQDHQFTRLVVEGHGDPRDSNAFQAAGYLQLNGFPLPKLLTALDLVETPIEDDMAAVNRGTRRASGDLDTQLWFVGTPRRGMHFRGYFVTYGLPVAPEEGVREPEQLAAKVHGYWQQDADWHLAFNNLELRWPELPSQRLNAHVSGSVNQPTVLAIEHLDLALWHQVLEHSGMLPGALSTVLADLQPYGEVHNARLQWVGAEQGYMQVRAHLREAGVRAWQGAPAMDGVDGYLDADAWGGQLLLDRQGGLTMDFPTIYHHPLAFTEVSGGLRWHIDREREQVVVSSSPLRVVNEDGDATGHLNLRLPFGGKTQAEPEMTLMIGAWESPAMRHRELVPFILPDALYQWLGQSIQGGQLSEIGFIYHGTLLPESRLSRAVQLSAKVEQAELAFADDWPPLTQAQGRLLLDNQAFFVTDVQGRMMDVPIAAATVALIENPSDQGLALDIRGQSQADSGSLMALLQNSPVGSLMGEELASWDVRGRAQGELELLIPLHAGASGAHQAVQVQLVDNRLFIPRLNLNFEAIHGTIHYSTDHGFRAPGLSAQLWEQAVDLDVHTDLTPEQNYLQVGFTGNLDFAQLPEWLKHDHWSPLISGVAPVNGQLQVPLKAGNPILFQADSQLEGVLLNLPEPMFKERHEAWPVAMTIAISPDTDLAPGVEQYRIGLDERADLRLSMQRGQLKGLTLALGDKAEAIQPGAINVQGTLGSVEWRPWRVTLGQLFPLEEPRPEAPGATPALPVNVA